MTEEDLSRQQNPQDSTMGFLTMFALVTYMSGFFLSVPFFNLLYGRSFKPIYLPNLDFGRKIVELIREVEEIKE